MSAAKHTPAPWETRTHGNGFIDIVADVQVIDGCVSWQGVATMNESDDVARADAHLIAAAPDMLQTLIDMDGWLANTGHGTDHPWRVSIRAAIAKATGEQPAHAAADGDCISSPEIPEGWKLVPIEPTTEMCLAEWNVGMSDAHSSTGVSACAWAAMLAAAPEYVPEVA